MKIEYNKDITDLTTFHVSAKTAVYAEYENEKDLLCLSRSEEFINNEILHIGSGSNLLFVNDFKGLVLHSAIKGIKQYRKNDNTVFVIAGAGEKWTDLVDWCIDRNLAGLENLAGIPGEVGASAVQNVGAYGAEAGDFIHSVECFDIESRKSITLKAEDCHFGYRDSVFKHEAKGRLIVMRVCYRLRPSTVATNLRYAALNDFAKSLDHKPSIREIAEEVKRLRDSKLPDPTVIGSAGSFFKNPIVSEYFLQQEVLPRGVEIPVHPAGEGLVKLSAAWLIDHAGLKGKRIGGAVVWQQQPLVIANEGTATAHDVVQLSDLIVETVKNKYGIELQPEVNFIDTSIKITVLGSGTSKGIPEIGCTCHTCTSDDPKDKRLRASIVVETHGQRILIDASPDLRQQMLRNSISHLDAVLLTHQHYDHVGGIDDIRPLCAFGDLPIYTNKQTDSDLHNRVDYCFRTHRYPGVPKLDLHAIGLQPFFINGLKIEPIEVMHGALPIYGFKIGKFAYVTDAKYIADSEKEKLKGLEVLILNCLRFKHEHFAHIIWPEAKQLIEELKPKRCYLTHMCHMFGRHEEVAPTLPEGVEIAYDNEVITI